MAGLVQSVEGPKKKDRGSSGKKQFSLKTASGLQLATPTLPWVSSLPAYPEHFELASPHNHMSQFLSQLPRTETHKLKPPQDPSAEWRK